MIQNGYKKYPINMKINYLDRSRFPSKSVQKVGDAHPTWLELGNETEKVGYAVRTERLLNREVAGVHG